MLLLAINLILTFLPLLHFLVEGFVNIIRDWLGGVDNGPRKTMAWLLGELRRQNRRERIRDRQRRQIRRHLKKINKKQTRTTSKDLHKTVDQTTVRNVLICLFDIQSQSTTDLGMTLTTDKQKTGKELVPYRPPASLLNLRVDVTAACDLARVFQTMLAAVHVSQITRRGHVTEYSPTGLEVVVYRPRHVFHRLTLDLTVACDIARMFQSPSAALSFVVYSKPRVLDIHAELLDSNDDVQTQIVADETVSVDSEKQSCDDIFSLGESCDQQQTDVTTGLGTSNERDVEKEGSHAFLFDEDIAKLPYVEPMRPQQLVKWEELSDVTDHGLELDQDQTTVRNVLICLFDIFQSTTDLGMTLTTDKQKTGKELVPYRPPARLLNLRVDVTAACELARVFQTMLAAVHASQTTRREHVTDYSPTGLEVVVYRPRHFFHRLTLDLTVACDIARMFQSPSAALIFVDNSKLRVFNIHAELLDSNDDVQTQIVADETVIVDSEKQSCDDIIPLGESCDQQQTDVTTGLGTSHEREVEKEGSHAFLFDEDIAKLPYVEPMRPQQLVKWEELSDVTDHGLELDQGEGWDVTDMFAANEADFGFKSTFDESLSEYTTLLVKEATPDYQLRWERACRLADEIEGKKKAEQANRAKQPKKRKKQSRRSKKSGCPYK